MLRDYLAVHQDMWPLMIEFLPLFCLFNGMLINFNILMFDFGHQLLLDCL